MAVPFSPCGRRESSQGDEYNASSASMYEEYVVSSGIERFRYCCPFSRLRILSFMAV